LRVSGKRQDRFATKFFSGYRKHAFIKARVVTGKRDRKNKTWYSGLFYKT